MGKDLALAATLCCLLLASCSSQSMPPTTTPVATPTANARADECLQAFETVWQTINDEYFDPTFGGVDWRSSSANAAPGSA
jgi:hypothetical protein